MNVMRRIFLIIAILAIGIPCFAKKVKYRKVQEVDFEQTDIDGKVRNPDGAYLVQKRGVDFLPMYKVKSTFDENIKESFEYLR